MSDKLLPFRWYGSKYSHLNWLLPKLPYRNEYVEPFGGTGTVLLNREPSPVETFNDLDGEVTNFFRVLRDNPDELISKLSATPFSRPEYEDAIEKHGDDSLDSVERARLFMVRAGQVRNGLAQDATPGRWAMHKQTSRRNMAGGVSRWWGRIESLDAVASRLQRVQIENDDAISVIERFDSPTCLVYCDPPYPHEARSADKPYRFEMTNDEHRELAEVLHNCDADVAISSYQCELMNELYNDWTRVDEEKKTTHISKDTRQESLWVNYDIDEAKQQRTQSQTGLGEFNTSEN